MSIKDNILNIKEEIGDQVKLVAVSKTRSIDEIKEAYNSNQKIFGENRVQEIVEKQQLLPDDIEWHMIGHLQKNKVKYISNFIKDINRGRILKVSSIMKKKITIKAPKILHTICIEDSIPIIASTSEGVAAVVDNNGNIIGAVSLDSAISAISSKE